MVTTGIIATFISFIITSVIGPCWFSVGGGWALWVWDSQKAVSEEEEEREIF